MRLGLTLARSAVIGCMAVTLLYGQQPMTSRKRTAALRTLSADLHQRHVAERRQVARLAAAAGLPLRRHLLDGRTVEIQRFIDGRPLCYITTNLNAARTVSTDLLWLDGGMGLDLSGSNITAGIWDDGGVLTTHQEFGGRVTPADGSAIGSNHPTHVAGTMIASGFFEPAARGMAGEAVLQSYDWDDDGAEMAAAAAEGLALSNHSYSYIVGWQEDHPNPGWNWWGDAAINDTVDYFFGFYDNTAGNWDQVAVNAPYYLIVAAAGNDRGENGPVSPAESYWWMNPANNYTWEETTLAQHPRNPDGDYDCLPGGPQVAKNVLVVGAVDDIPDGYVYPTDVVMTDFSSWGPTDDGRIKPDLVANGMDLYSTLKSGNAAYGYSSGTSMAAPNVTGSVALLQQHYRQTHNESLPLAATLRALLIQTADEAGTAPGPDYSHGWGLLNTAEAAKLISWDAGNQRIIQELILDQGDSYSTTVTSDGTYPMKVTIAWTDPPGTVPSPQLNPRTPVLVNDLDLRITRESDGYVYYPWRLNVDAPEETASQDDNSVDNVEQVLIPTPGPGEYTITVSHKNTLLAGVQGFSMVITGEGRPQVLVWEGVSAGVDYSGIFIRDRLQAIGELNVTYTTTFPSSLAEYEAVFLSFGPPPGDAPKGTPFNNTMAEIVRSYLEGGGSLYLEGGDALGIDQSGNTVLLTLLGIASTADGYGAPNPINGLEGQPSAITNGMSFTSSTQVNTTYIDSFIVSSGIAAFVESNYGTVAVQHTGSYGQRTFAFSYALAGLVDGAAPSTRSNLLAALLDFFVGEARPLALNDFETTLEDSAVTIMVLANDIDPNGDALFLTDITQGVHGLVVMDAGATTVTYTPEANFFGPDSFTYEISDGHGGLDTGIVKITVTPVNDKPLAGTDQATTAEDVAVVIPVLRNDTDIDGDTLLLVDVTPGDHGATAINDGDTTVTYTPAADFFGPDSFTYEISDGHGGLDTGRVEIFVTQANDPPVFISTIADTSFKEDSTLSLPLSLWFNAVEDQETPDSQLDWSITGNDSVYTTLSADSVLFSAPLNWHGVDTLSVIAGDGAQADTTSLIITVFPVNDAPGNFAMLTPAGDSILVITSGNLADTLTFSWELADDVDGDAVRYGALVTDDLNIVLTIGDTAANEVRLANADIAALLEAAGKSSGFSGTWVIFASDGGDITWADNGPFTLTVSVALAIDPLAGVPKEFALRQNYPNPFNPNTTLRFALPREVKVRLVVVDLLGREIARLVDETLPAGFHQVVWDGKTRRGKEAPSGVYIARLLATPTAGMAPGFVHQVKMVLLR